MSALHVLAGMLAPASRELCFSSGNIAAPAQMDQPSVERAPYAAMVETAIAATAALGPDERDKILYRNAMNLLDRYADKDKRRPRSRIRCAYITAAFTGRRRISSRTACVSGGRLPIASNVGRSGSKRSHAVASLR